MDPERFKLVEEILAEARERLLGERAAFIENRCGGDAELRAEVESLLGVADDAEHYFDAFADRALVTPFLVDDATESLVGRTVSHFRVTAEAGRGGMGTVYRATDTRLGREVALKVMPDFVTDDAEQLARFRREARVLAKLNHPGIGALYDLEEVDGRLVLVLEFVEGHTLRDRLKQGRIQLREVLDIACRIASALEGAHLDGIVHRDLKPANVMLRPDGEVKLLDFGIAKGLERESRGDFESTPSPTEIAAATLHGQVLGTRAYMSPEQARGRHVDHRTDVWAFGVVLFEMLAGRRPFTGADTAQTLARILERDPDWDALPVGLPAPIRKLLERCLHRDPRQRLQAVGEARITIETYRSVPTPAPIAHTASTRGRWITAAAIVLAAVAGWALRPSAERLPGVPQNLLLALPDGASVARLSPDGTNLFYRLGDDGWLLPLDQSTPRRLTGAENALNPFWAGDSRSVVFRRDDKLWRVPIEGAGAQLISDLPPGIYTGGAWLEGDTVLFAMPEGIFHVPARGGTPQLLVARDMAGEAAFREPSPLPGGGFLFAVATDGVLEVWRGGSRKTLLRLEDTMLRDPVYSAPGHVVFHRMDRGGEIWAVPFSLSDLETTGAPFLIEAANAVPTVSHDGTLAFRRLTDERRQMVWVDRTGRIEGVVSEPQVSLSWPAISPDGDHIVVSAADGGRRNLWIHDVQSQSFAPFTFSANERHRYPFWNADGTRVGFNVNTAASEDLADKAVGTDIDVANDSLAGGAVAGAFSPDGRYLVYHRRFETTGSDILVTPVEGGESRPFLVTRQHEGWVRVSPDGTLLAYGGGPTGFPEIFVRPFPTGEGFWQVSTATGVQPRWGPHGRELLYWQQDDLMVVRVDRSERVPRFSRPERLFSATPLEVTRGEYDVAPDGRLLLVRTLSARGPGLPHGMVLFRNWAAAFQH